MTRRSLAMPFVAVSLVLAAAAAAHAQIFAYVGNSGEATVSQFGVRSDGTLTPLSPAKVTLPVGTGVAGIAIDSGGRFVFTLGYGNGGSPVTSWAIADDGTLSPVGTPRRSDGLSSSTALCGVGRRDLPAHRQLR